MRTVVFHENVTSIKLEAFDMREKYTSTSTLLGMAFVALSELKGQQRLRMKLESPNPSGRTAGFITLTTWFFDSKIPASTDSTPVHVTKAVKGHKRSLSLPCVNSDKAHWHSDNNNLNLLYSNPSIKTFRFHSGLAGEIKVHNFIFKIE